MVTSTVPNQRGSRARAARRLGYLGGFAAFGVALSAAYATTGNGLPCPFRLATGWDCPLCGGTRMGSALLHLDLATAASLNPVVLVGLVLLSLYGASLVVELLTGARLQVPEALSRRLRRIPVNGWLVVSLMLAVLYTLLRNLL